MTSKTLRILFGTFALLLIAASFPWWSSYFRSSEKSFTKNQPIFSVFSLENTESVRMEREGKQITLVKEDGTWRSIEGMDINKNDVEKFFDAITGLKIQNLVSRNPENHNGFGLTGKGTSITFVANGEETTFIIGDSGLDYASFYLKTKDDKNAYLVSGDLSEYISKDAIDWQEETDATITPEIAEEIQTGSGTNTSSTKVSP